VRRAAKVDLNHGEVIAALRGIQCSVRSLAAVGSGVPDLLVGIGNMNLLLEVKSHGGKLTEDQLIFAAGWNGQVKTVYSAEEAVNYVKACLALGAAK
jgi:hypothetical protein